MQSLLFVPSCNTISYSSINLDYLYPWAYSWNLSQTMGWAHMHLGACKGEYIFWFCLSLAVFPDLKLSGRWLCASASIRVQQGQGNLGALGASRVSDRGSLAWPQPGEEGRTYSFHSRLVQVTKLCCVRVGLEHRQSNPWKATLRGEGLKALTVLTLFQFCPLEVEFVQDRACWWDL